MWPILTVSSMGTMVGDVRMPLKAEHRNKDSHRRRNRGGSTI